MLYFSGGVKSQRSEPSLKTINPDPTVWGWDKYLNFNLMGQGENSPQVIEAWCRKQMMRKKILVIIFCWPNRQLLCYNKTKREKVKSPFLRVRDCLFYKLYKFTCIIN